MNLLVTGTAGFIGSAFVRMLLGAPRKAGLGQPVLGPGKIVSLDLLTYAGCLDNLTPIMKHPQHVFVKGDICDRKLVESLVKEHKIDGILNFAAESHVDRSIEDSQIFATTNVQGTLNLLEIARIYGLKYLQVSTDEVYGTLGDTGSFTEETPMAPNSPYSASKAASDCFVRAYVHTHGLDAIITRCSNNYGPYQFPEKFLPLAITKLMRGEKIPVYGDGRNVRDWLHVEDHSEGIWLAYTKGKKGEVYNFGGFGERRNIEMAHLLIKKFGRTEADGLKFVEDRKGHDWRYSMDPAKVVRELGWKPRWSLEAGIDDLVDWYKTNETWWKPKLPATMRA
ncbi:MAG: dTDP-glucose 4,6-dehydratase [Bdellovibrionales bacterium]|nr:dTDP-glucose 4,6-dehydratase [Bdellovibrionales bacterium]